MSLLFFAVCMEGVMNDELINLNRVACAAD
jgi:hypothetical protein